MSTRFALVSVAVLALFAGCGGLGSPGASSTQATTGVTNTTTVSQMNTTSQAVEPREFQTLSNASQGLALEAIENGEATALRTNLSGDLRPRMNWSQLRYQGTVYDLSWQRVGLVAQYKMSHTSHVSASEIENVSDGIAYGNLSDRAQRFFTEARAGNESAWYSREAFPAEFHDHHLVKYQREYYRVIVYTGDFEQYRLSATPTDG